MARRRTSHPGQADLLDWQPPTLVATYDERRVRALSLRDKVALAIKATLEDCGKSRAQVAGEMSTVLGEDVTVPMLDAYASQAKSEHTISYLRLLALVAVTADPRPLQIGAELCAAALIPVRYVAAVEAEMLRDQVDHLTARMNAKRRAWRGGR